MVSQFYGIYLKTIVLSIQICKHLVIYILLLLMKTMFKKFLLNLYFSKKNNKIQNMKFICIILCYSYVEAELGGG